MLPEQDAFIEKLYHEFFTQLWIYAKAALGDPEPVSYTHHRAHEKEYKFVCLLEH